MAVLRGARERNVCLRALSILPRWDGADGLERYRAYVVNGGGMAIDLPKHSHSYYDYQAGNRITARFASVGFALGYDTDMEKAEAASVFDMLRCEAAPIRKRTRNEARGEA